MVCAMVALTVRGDRQGAEGAAARPPRRRPAPGDDRRAGRRRSATRCPPTDAEALGRWFVAAADSGSLERYLETFAHTVAVMQTAEALHRVAAECALDLAADGVVYAEVRFAPEQHLDRGPDAGPRWSRRCWPGSREGAAQAAAAGHPIRVGTLLTAMRHAARSHGDRRAGGAVPRRAAWSASTSPAPRPVPAHPAPGRLRVPAAGELPLHDPRRRGVRAAVDLAGDPVVRRRPARPRRADRRRHHRSATARARPAGRVRAGQAHPAGAVPVVQRADRRGRRRSPSTRSGCCATCGSGSRSTPTTG